MVSMSAFCFVTLRGLVGRYQRFRRTYFGSEDGGSMFLRNVRIYLQVPHGVTTETTNISDAVVTYLIHLAEVAVMHTQISTDQ
jgi:hypothetical protein